MGNVPWEYFEKVIPYTDLFLYDIKAFTENLHIQGTGVSNRLVLENLSILSGKREIIVRIPVIGGFNDNIDEIKNMALFLNDIKYQKVELLPYHSMGKQKYEAPGIKCDKYSVPDEKIMKKAKEMFN